MVFIYSLSKSNEKKDGGVRWGNQGGKKENEDGWGVQGGGDKGGVQGEGVQGGVQGEGRRKWGIHSTVGNILF